MVKKRVNTLVGKEMSRKIDQIRVGETASLTRSFESADLRAWVSATGEQVLSGEGGLGILVAMVSGLASSRMPGPGSVLQSVAVKLNRSIRAGDTINAQIMVKDKRVPDRLVIMDAHYTDADGNVIATGTLEVTAPEKPLPLRKSHSLDQLFSLCAGLPQMRTGVVWPMSEESLASAIVAKKLVTPVLYGPKAALLSLSRKAGIDLALMKGSLHTDVILHAVLQKEAQLTTGRLLSHCALISAPTFPRWIVLSDVALNIAPDVDQKRDICQNAIGFARAVGIVEPRVAVLSAVETVRTKMTSTLDAAIIAKMADRGQIVGGIVDGPLDLDAAIDEDAARIKNIVSPVAGVADVLIVPNIEAGNMIYKEFAFMADAQTAGLVVGARVPVILTSRADSVESHLYSAAAAVVYADVLARDPASILLEVKE
jgi:phosphate acetyltransferase